MRCELCGCELDDDTMVGHGEFFVCEDCDDATAAKESISEPTAPLAELAAELATKH